MASPPGVYGLEEALANLRLLHEVATQQNVLRRALVKAAQPIADAAVRLAPDDPATPAPDLRSSIGVATQLIKSRRAEREKGVTEVYIGPTKVTGRAVMRYASNVEYGTFRAAPHPYLRPAFDSQKAAVTEILARELKVEFDKAVGRIARKQAKAR